MRYARADTAAGPYAENPSKRPSPIRNQRSNAMRGGMLSGWAASRSGQLSGPESQLTFGGWQGGHRPRWPLPTSTITFQRAAIGDGRPTYPASVTA